METRTCCSSMSCRQTAGWGGRLQAGGTWPSSGQPVPVCPVQQNDMSKMWPYGQSQAVPHHQGFPIDTQIKVPFPKNLEQSNGFVTWSGSEYGFSCFSCCHVCQFMSLWTDTWPSGQPETVPHNPWWGDADTELRSPFLTAQSYETTLSLMPDLDQSMVFHPVPTARILSLLICAFQIHSTVFFSLPINLNFHFKYKMMCLVNSESEYSCDFDEFCFALTSLREFKMEVTLWMDCSWVFMMCAFLKQGTHCQTVLSSGISCTVDWALNIVTYLSCTTQWHEWHSALWSARVCPVQHNNNFFVQYNTTITSLFSIPRQ